MTDPEQILFQQLIKEVETTYKVSYPYCQTPIEEWKGQDIVNFQEDLIKKVNGRISEKWFYTHIKGKLEKIPRLDMLNMLSQYTGYKDWQHFTGAHANLQNAEKESIIIQKPLADVKIETLSPPPDTAVKKRWQIKTIVPMLGFSFLLLSVYWFLNKEKTYQFCFIDAHIKYPIKNIPLDIIILNKDESPVYMKADSNGCFIFSTSQNQVHFIVKSPYYKTDTIIRFLNKENTEEAINLTSDDYALMIHYFSTAKLEDWKSRRNKLNEIFCEEAQIFQLHPNGQTGMELFNKQEFIDKITIPVNSLKNIDVIDIQYKNGQISELKFRQLN